MTRILLIEDDPDLASSLDLALTSLGHQVQLAPDGLTGLAELTDGRFEAVLLDVMMPGIDGFETARRIRASGLVPIIMLTARSDPMDIVVGLECGADDYVTKPAEPRVLDARIKAVLRRSTPVAANVLRFGELQIDRSAMSVERAGRAVPLTPTELRLLVELAEHAGQVLSRHQLLQRVWDYGYAGDSRLVDAVVQRLRSKIEPVPATPSLIVTVRGIGYRMERP